MSIKNRLISRRDFLKNGGIGAAIFATGIWGYRRYLSPMKYAFTGNLVGANSEVGHLLRTGVKVVPSETKSIHTIIVGGGISGLSAAWWLKKNNFTDFKLFEMDSELGGNSASGRNLVSAYPWGAHYVPLPGPDAHYVREFFEEVGIIEKYEKGLPVFNEYYLCSDSHERLLFQGEWQDGLIPQRGIQLADKNQYDQFFAFVESLKNRKGKDGKPAFNIPMELSSKDPELLELDRVSMASFMESKGWTSRYLNWYVSYCCRDDYGMPHNQVSAWAGLHYFASRSGHGANADSQTVLTWPEGNGFLVTKLKAKVGTHVKSNSLVFQVENIGEDQVTVNVLNTRDQSCVQYRAKNVIFCGPRFIANKVIAGYSSETALDYSPWMIANITVKEKPQSHGVDLAWDNVSFYSKSLGYIVANHQDLKINRKETVLTYYLPLDENAPKEERMAAYRKDYQDWLDILVPDLEKMHPGICKQISHVDIWVWGHGMISPGIDFLWSKKRQDLLKPFGRIEFAHSDMSGISIFEEAQFRGIEAAKRVLGRLRA